MTQEAAPEKAKKLHISLLQGPRLITGLQAFDDHLARAWRARMLVSLLAVRQGAPVTLEEIHKYVYEKDASLCDSRSLHVQISRIRGTLESCGAGLSRCILNKHGSYQLNMEMVGELDVLTMRNLCILILESPEMNGMCWDRVEKLQEIYQRAPLDEYAQKEWAQPYREDVQALYHRTVSHALSLLWRKEAHENILYVCQRGLRAMPGVARWRQDLEKAEVLAASRSAFPEEPHDDTFSVRMDALLGDLYKDENKPSLSARAEELVAMLNNVESKGGAQLCDFFVLPYLFELQERCLERTAEPACLALIELRDKFAVSNHLTLEAGMSQLRELLCANLRSCDIVVRHSPTEWAVVLRSVSQQDAAPVLERIRKRFRNIPICYSLEMTYCVEALERGKSAIRKQGHHPEG